MKKTILIVDDERDLREILAFNLSRLGYVTLEAASAFEAEGVIKSEVKVDLILLDVMMGEKSGFEFASELKTKGVAVPIIFLTALDTESDLLKGFSLGADDYIAKPFSIAEVQARVNAVLLRTSEKSNPIISIGDITLDTEAKTVKIGTEDVQLTKTEFKLLLLMAKKPEKSFSREELLSKVWGNDVYVESRTVDVHIARLRKKIESSELQIISRSGYGYSLK